MKNSVFYTPQKTNSSRSGSLLYAFGLKSEYSTEAAQAVYVNKLRRFVNSLISSSTEGIVSNSYIDAELARLEGSFSNDCIVKLAVILDTSGIKFKDTETRDQRKQALAETAAELFDVLDNSEDFRALTELELSPIEKNDSSYIGHANKVALAERNILHDLEDRKFIRRGDLKSARNLLREYRRYKLIADRFQDDSQSAKNLVRAQLEKAGISITDDQTQQPEVNQFPVIKPPNNTGGDSDAEFYETPTHERLKRAVLDILRDSSYVCGLNDDLEIIDNWQEALDALNRIAIDDIVPDDLTAEQRRAFMQEAYAAFMEVKSMIKKEYVMNRMKVELDARKMKLERKNEDMKGIMKWYKGFIGEFNKLSPERKKILLFFLSAAGASVVGIMTGGATGVMFALTKYVAGTLTGGFGGLYLSKVVRSIMDSKKKSGAIGKRLDNKIDALDDIDEIMKHVNRNRRMQKVVEFALPTLTSVLVGLTVGSLSADALAGMGVELESMQASIDEDATDVTTSSQSAQQQVSSASVPVEAAATPTSSELTESQPVTPTDNGIRGELGNTETTTITETESSDGMTTTAPLDTQTEASDTTIFSADTSTPAEAVVGEDINGGPMNIAPPSDSQVDTFTSEAPVEVPAESVTGLLGAEVVTLPDGSEFNPEVSGVYASSEANFVYVGADGELPALSQEALASEKPFHIINGNEMFEVNPNVVSTEDGLAFTGYEIVDTPLFYLPPTIDDIANTINTFNASLNVVS